ncbi:E3 ubiquitin-protein ligase RNF220-like [Nerophis ophidion]|uniref:E3 ubiquitin-protein ligase RNF220-like n=1 Tax=Nerophis ophidion TaxID=159077 RepID=UPI002ADFCBD4|nr:E3 ubiquitin-protein ligase RNF220-like [Nerophis ophidion]
MLHHLVGEGHTSMMTLRPLSGRCYTTLLTFLRVRANRHTRLNVEELCWCRCYVTPAPLRPHGAGVHLDCTPAESRNISAALDERCQVRISRLKRRKAEDGQEVHANTTLSEDEWSERRKIQMMSLLGGFKGAMLVSSRAKEGRDSDADLDVDGDDTLAYGRAQYCETDVMMSAGDNIKETTANSSMPDSADHRPTCTRSSQGSPSTSTERLDALPKSCNHTDTDMLSEDDTLTSLDALKARIRDLEKQLCKGDRFKCLICMDSYTTPLTSIQCWHVHCEECWLRTLGAKKLCPQCNTITSPGDLRRVYL